MPPPAPPNHREKPRMWMDVHRRGTERKTSGSVAGMDRPIDETSFAKLDVELDEVADVLAHMELDGGIGTEPAIDVAVDCVPGPADLLPEIALERSEMLVEPLLRSGEDVATPHPFASWKVVVVAPAPRPGDNTATAPGPLDDHLMHVASHCVLAPLASRVARARSVGRAAWAGKHTRTVRRSNGSSPGGARKEGRGNAAAFLIAPPGLEPGLF